MPTAREPELLRLALPARCPEPVGAIEKWLLALWHAYPKRTWSFWRTTAISLEFVASPEVVQLQVHCATQLGRSISPFFLNGVLPGIDLEPLESRLVVPTGRAALATFRFRHGGWVELAKDRDPDAVAALLETLAPVEEGERVVVQLLIEPTWMTTEDGRQPAFWLAGRVVAWSRSYAWASQLVRRASSGFGQFAGFNGLRFSSVRPASRSRLDEAERRRWPHVFLPLDPPATPNQVARLFHPPEDPAAHTHLYRSLCTRPAITSKTTGALLGIGRSARGGPESVRLNASDLLRHALVVGPSGTGKSTLLAHLARELVREGHGVTIIDPHGQLVRAIARTVPASRERDAALVSVADRDFPLGLNPLQPREGFEFAAADEFVEIVQRVYGREYWGPLIDLVLRHAAMAAIEVQGSVLETARLLDDDGYRSRVLARIEDEETARVLGQIADGLDRRLLPAINRLQRLLANPLIRNILGQSENLLDFGQAFDDKRVLLFDLSGIGATNARLIGSLLLLLIRQATLARSAAQAKHAQHFVLVDEASWFLSRTVSELFDQARKFGVGVVLAAQRTTQLAPADVREAVLGNVGTLLSFRAHEPEEAKLLAQHLGARTISAGDLEQLPRYEAYARMLVDGERTNPVWLQVPSPPKELPSAGRLELQLTQAARQWYARPRAIVEAELRSRTRIAAQDDEPEIRTIEARPLLANAA